MDLEELERELAEKEKALEESEEEKRVLMEDYKQKKTTTWKRKLLSIHLLMLRRAYKASSTPACL